MEITNPRYKLGENGSIFSIRQKEYENLESSVREILKAAEEIGFTVNDFGIREPRVFPSNELDRTLKKNFVIKLQRGTSEVDLSMSIPKLLDSNYIMINGRKKIPLFQLFDIPIVTRGKNIKVRTNVATMMISEEKQHPFVSISLLGKKVSLALLMFSVYTKEYLDSWFHLSELGDEIEVNNLFDKVVYDLKVLHTSYPDYTQDDFTRELGKAYSKYDPLSKGSDVVYSLSLILKTDIMSAKFFRSGDVLAEIIEVIKSGGLDDKDYLNKRVRCFEYVIFSKISKVVFDLCMAARKTKNVKFSTSSTQILAECNVSDIVQFDFSINPIDEITKLSRTSLIGPGGFNRENVPKHLRDISESMFGRVCPVDTPDRENCGVLQDLVANVKLDENLKFSKVLSEPISIPVSMVPFLEHDDQTRLQMASSQMRQSIALLKFEPPMIQSGCEGLYTDKTQFLNRAKRDGEVLYYDSRYLIVVYEDKTLDLFELPYRRIYVENLDYTSGIYFKQGDKFKKGDILFESIFCSDGKINIGKNLLTVIMSYGGYNYEDGILISDKLTNQDSPQTLTSLHFIDLSFNLKKNEVLIDLPYRTAEEDRFEEHCKHKIWKPLPDPSGQMLKVLEKKEIDLYKKKGQSWTPLEGEFWSPESEKKFRFETLTTRVPYAIVKEIPSGPSDFCGLFKEEEQYTIKKPFVFVTDVNIYANDWNSEFDQFSEWMTDKINIQKEYQNKVAGIIRSSIPKDIATDLIRERMLDKFGNENNYKEKGERINGTRVEIFGLYIRQISVGDKIGNRHGNKGVISRIVPHEMMPKLPDGRHAEVVINPLGIPSRMNIGQVFEIHMTMALENLKKNALALEKDKRKEYLLNFIKIIDNTEGKWYSSQFEEQIKDVEVDEKFIGELVLIQPPFESVTKQMVAKAMEYTNTPYKFDVFLPEFNSMSIKPVTAGYLYFFRMVHIAESRLAARGIGAYARRTVQPLGGRKNKGGQRCGEMETCCIIAHDAPFNLREMLTTKSDCIDLKNLLIKKAIETETILREQKPIDEVPESVKLLDSYLRVIGVEK
jgi:DNA-directed RNA polymerase subunit beta